MLSNIIVLMTMHTVLYPLLRNPNLTKMAPTTQIRLDRLSYVIYEHPDAGNFNDFAAEFGFEHAGQVDKSTFYKGYGADRYVYVAQDGGENSSKRFLGAGFRASSEQDFQRAVSLDTAELVDGSKRPGKGSIARVTDPNGYFIEIVWAQEEQSVPSDGLSSLVSGRGQVNGALVKNRKGEYALLASDGTEDEHGAKKLT